MGAGALTEILGQLHGRADVDLYRLCLSDGDSFSASTVGATRSTPSSSSSIRRGTGSTRTTTRRACTGPCCRRITGSRPAPAANSSSGSARSTTTPRARRARSSRTSSTRSLYPDGVVNASGFGGAQPLTGWAGRASGPGGHYRITLTGTAACDTTPPTVDLRSPGDGAHVGQGDELSWTSRAVTNGRLGPRLVRGHDPRRRGARHERAGRRLGDGHRARQRRQPDGRHAHPHGRRRRPARGHARRPRRTAPSTSAARA